MSSVGKPVNLSHRQATIFRSTSKSLVVGAAFSFVVSAMGSSCEPLPPAFVEENAEQLNGDIGRAWMDFFFARIAEYFVPPPHASRMYAYISVAMYETAASNSDSLRSLAGQLRDMPTMPPHPTEPIDLATAMWQAAETTTQAVFPYPSVSNEFREELKRLVKERFDAGVPLDVIERSLAYGLSVGKAVGEWSGKDGFRERRLDSFAPPQIDGQWIPTNSDPPGPLEPYWNTVKPLVLPSADACDPGPHIPFSSDPASEFRSQVNTVHQTVLALTEEQKTTAKFWADGEATLTPPGHWMSIAGIVGRQEDLNLAEQVRAYALIGVGTMDAFISCWDTKYRYYLVRPFTYIKENIDPAWTPFIKTPPFPEYTSGHSTVSGASSSILATLFGESYAFTDDTHVGRNFAARDFTSFAEAADEAALSRLLGGIHYPMSNAAGLSQGQCVANFVVGQINTFKE